MAQAFDELSAPGRVPEPYRPLQGQGNRDFVRTGIVYIATVTLPGKIRTDATHIVNSETGCSSNRLPPIPGMSSQVTEFAPSDGDGSYVMSNMTYNRAHDVVLLL